MVNSISPKHSRKSMSIRIKTEFKILLNVEIINSIADQLTKQFALTETK